MSLIIAIPKGRILSEVQPLMARAGIVPEPGFFDEEDRRLMFKTGDDNVQLVRVRSFDVATFVAQGGAQAGICGSDVLAEFDYPDLYSPVDLNIGRCRISLAAPQGATLESLARLSHVRVASKYPRTTTDYFASRGIQAECIKLSGAMELAPMLGIAPYIVDLVSSGATLKANNLAEIDVIAQVSSRLIVHRNAFKTNAAVQALVQRFRGGQHGA